MSEKHLTDLLWKTVAVKQGVKDIGLQKALANYGRIDAAKEPAKALEALTEISELALKLKKLCAAKADVVDHLDEIVKEVKKTKPPLEARAKTAAEDPKAAQPEGKAPAEDEAKEEEAEAAQFKKDIKKEMTAALARVKQLAPGELERGKEPNPQLKFMAYLAGKGCAVVVSRKVGSATKNLLPEIAGGATGGKFYRGECIFENNAHTFVLDAVPGGLAKKLAAALKAETGQVFKVRVRSTDGSMVLDSDTDVDPDASPVAPATPPPAPDTAKEMAAFVARLRALQPDIVKAAGTKTPGGDEAKQRAAEAGTRANAKDFAGANQLLDAVEALVRKALAAAAPPPPKPAPAAAAAAAPKPPAAPKLSTYMNATRDWRAAKKAAADSMFALKNAILKECDAELQNAVKAKINDLSSIFAMLDDSIIAKIEDAGREADEERQHERNQALAKLGNNMLTAFRGHPLANVVDHNPFGTFTIRAPVESFLTKFVADFGA